MTSTEHKACYGTMFPNWGPQEIEHPQLGKVFTLEVVTPVGMLPQRHAIGTNLREWDDCLACPTRMRLRPP